MKSRKVASLIMGILIFVAFFSGIFRDDVSEEAYLQLAQQKQFDCVGRIIKDTTPNGSCVLINDRFALSAAHVFIDNDIRMDTMHYNGQRIILYVPINKRLTDVSGLYIMINEQKVKVKNIVLHPNYLDSLTEGSCDIALIELMQTLTMVSPAKLNLRFDELNLNVVGVGYGASGPANRPDLVGQYNRKIAGENVVDSFTGMELRGHKTLLMCDFDHPTNTVCNKTGSPKPRPLEYICSGGDSGGGLFRQAGQEWELIGICARGGVNVDQLNKTGYYGQTMEWTRVSIFNSWIREHIK